jgi:hypothetical protein
VGKDDRLRNRRTERKEERLRNRRTDTTPEKEVIKNVKQESARTEERG